MTRETARRRHCRLNPPKRAKTPHFRAVRVRGEGKERQLAFRHALLGRRRFDEVGLHSSKSFDALASGPHWCVERFGNAHAPSVRAVRAYTESSVLLPG